MQRQRLAEEESLHELVNDALSFSDLVDAIVRHAVDGLQQVRPVAARVALAESASIAERRREFEDRVESLLAGWDVEARDARLISALREDVAALEQVAGYAAGVARVVLLSGDRALLDPLSSLPRMADKARGMLRRSLSALVAGDVRALRLAAAECYEMRPLRDQVELEARFFLGRVAHDIEYANRLLWVYENVIDLAERASSVACRLAREVAADGRAPFAPAPAFSVSAA